MNFIISFNRIKQKVLHEPIIYWPKSQSVVKKDGLSLRKLTKRTESPPSMLSPIEKATLILLFKQ